MKTLIFIVLVSLAQAALADAAAVIKEAEALNAKARSMDCLLYTSPSPRDVEESRMPSSA